MTVTLKLPRPHESQLSVLREHKRFNVLCCGRRWGKTTIALERLVRHSLAGRRVAWFNPTYKSLSDAWRDAQDVLGPVISGRDVKDHRLEMLGGGVLEFWSLDSPNTGRGRAYHCVIVDEAAQVNKLDEAWQKSIRPMLADYEGEGWFLSTPAGITNYFYELYQKGQDPLESEWASWQRPTSTNPYIKPTEIESSRNDLTELAFAQEYLAQFVLWTGAVFRRIMDAVKPITTLQGSIIGVDWGRTNDYTVFTTINPNGHVTEIDRFRGIEYSLQRARLAAQWERTGKRAWILAETNSMGGPVVEQLQRDGLPVAPFQTTNASKSAIIESLALAFERGLISIPNDPVLIGELQAFQASPLASGLMRYSAPAGQHDDCVMSLAFAWAGLTAPRQQTRYLDAETGALNDSYVPYQISAI